MEKVRNAVTLHPETVAKAESLAKETKARKRHKKPAKPKSVVKKTTVHPMVWKHALQLAGNDRKRLVVESATSVLVRNP